ncbi:MAG: zinc-ribbon domain-containing protein [Eubacteriales bacterium]|nr:zinc-ribbon domain-containing protein [Eubacteriales bacterium]
MHCANCGTQLSENTTFCPACGSGIKQASAGAPQPAGLRGFSPRISDPAFARYIKNTNRWSAIFSIILAVAAVIGFAIYGQTSREMENPQALFIGFAIGGMFLMIALFRIIRRKGSKTWDGVVVDKTIKKKTRRQDTGNHDTYIEYYTRYVVVIRDERGKKHRLIAEDDDTRYNYFQIGDRVRHHAGLKSYEKYDKSRDSILFCNACGTLCRISDDICLCCKCPLLK